ncbi:putative ankyrin repeat protein [Termitomyces sp. T112]|nr:putative ankyrin repeat protein [Termitomyces sp. T112]
MSSNITPISGIFGRRMDSVEKAEKTGAVKSENLGTFKQNADDGEYEDATLHFAEHKSKSFLNKYGRYEKTALYFASQYEDSNNVKLLPEQNADVNVKDSDGKTALHLASENGDSKTVKLLLEYNADVNVEDKDGKTALHVAVQRWDRSIVKLLLEHNVDVNVKALHFAGGRGSPQIVKLLLKHKADVNVKDNDGKTALHFAAQHFAAWRSNSSIVQHLLRHNADVDVKDKDGKTALHLASQNGDSNTIKVLLEYSADVHVKGKDEKTALHFVAEKGDSDIVKLLLEHKSDVNVKDKDEKTALHFAAERGDSGIVKLLLQQNANVHVKDKDKSTPLHLAAHSGNSGTIKLLLEHNADVHAKDKEEKTALYYATKRQNLVTVKLLCEHIANVKIEGEMLVEISFDQTRPDTVPADKDNKTALHFAAGSRNSDTVTLPVNNVDVNIKDKSEKATLYFAVPQKQGYLEYKDDMHQNELHASTEVVTDDNKLTIPLLNQGSEVLPAPASKITTKASDLKLNVKQAESNEVTSDIAQENMICNQLMPVEPSIPSSATITFLETQWIIPEDADKHIANCKDAVAQVLTDGAFTGNFSLHSAFNQTTINFEEPEQEIYIALDPEMDSEITDELQDALLEVVQPFSGIVITLDQEEKVKACDALMLQSQTDMANSHVDATEDSSGVNNENSNSNGTEDNSGHEQSGSDDRNKSRKDNDGGQDGGSDGGQGNGRGGGQGGSGGGGGQGNGSDGGQGEGGGGGGQDRGSGRGQGKEEKNGDNPNEDEDDQKKDDNDGHKSIWVPMSSYLTSTDRKEKFEISCQITAQIGHKSPQFGRPLLEVDIKDLHINSESYAKLYNMNLCQVRIMVSSCSLATYQWSPRVLHEEDPGTYREEQNLTGTGSLTISGSPSLSLTGKASSTKATERTQQPWSITSRQSGIVDDIPGKGVLWTYTPNLKGKPLTTESLEQGPNILFMLDGAEDLPTLEIQMGIFWSFNKPSELLTQAARSLLLRSVTRGLPVNLNFLHRVIMVVDLQRLEGKNNSVLDGQFKDKIPISIAAGNPKAFENHHLQLSKHSQSSNLKITAKQVVEGHIKGKHSDSDLLSLPSFERPMGYLTPSSSPRFTPEPSPVL